MVQPWIFMTSITRLNINEGLTSYEVECDQVVSKWLNKDISNGNRTKNDLVEGVHAASEKAITDLQHGITQINAYQQEGLQPYPYKDLFTMVGYCTLNSLIFLLAAGCLGTPIVLTCANLGINISALMFMYVGGVLTCAKFTVLGVWMAIKGTADVHEDYVSAVWHYERIEEGAIANYKHGLVSLITQQYCEGSGCDILSDGDAERERIANEIRATTSRRTLTKLGNEIIALFTTAIETIRQLQKEKLALANRFSDYMVVKPKDVPLSKNTFIDLIKSMELLEAHRKVISDSIYVPDLVRIVLSYLGMPQVKPA